MIYGNRLRLRAVYESDHRLLWQWRNDPRVKPGFVEQIPFSLEEHRTWWARIRQDPTEMQLMADRQEPDPQWGQAGDWTQALWVPVGTIGFARLSWRHRRADYVRWCVDPDQAGKGYGKEFDFLITDFAFSVLGLHRLTMDVLAENAYVVDLHQKCGYQVEGRWIEHFWIHGAWRDTILLGQTEAQWATLRGERARDLGIDPHYLMKTVPP